MGAAPGARGRGRGVQVAVHLSYTPAVQTLDVQSLLSAAHLLASSRFFFQHLHQARPARARRVLCRRGLQSAQPAFSAARRQAAQRRARRV